MFHLLLPNGGFPDPQKATCAYGTVDDAQAQVIQVATAMGRDHAQSGWFGIPVAKLQFCDGSWCFMYYWVLYIVLWCLWCLVMFPDLSCFMVQTVQIIPSCVSSPFGDEFPSAPGLLERIHQVFRTYTVAHLRFGSGDLEKRAVLKTRIDRN